MMKLAVMHIFERATYEVTDDMGNTIYDNYYYELRTGILWRKVWSKQVKFEKDQTIKKVWTRGFQYRLVYRDDEDPTKECRTYGFIDAQSYYELKAVIYEFLAFLADIDDEMQKRIDEKVYLERGIEQQGQNWPRKWEEQG